MKKKAYKRTTMIDPFSQAHILKAVVLLLVFGSLLATIDPSTQSNRKRRAAGKFQFDPRISLPYRIRGDFNVNHKVVSH